VIQIVIGTILGLVATVAALALSVVQSTVGNILNSLLGLGAIVGLVEVYTRFPPKSPFISFLDSNLFRKFLAFSSPNRSLPVL
jgi:hypothetical protein